MSGRAEVRRVRIHQGRTEQDRTGQESCPIHHYSVLPQDRTCRDQVRHFSVAWRDHLTQLIYFTVIQNTDNM